MYIFFLLVGLLASQIGVPALNASEAQLGDRSCCIVDEMQEIFNACCSALSELGFSIKSDIADIKNDIANLSARVDDLSAQVTSCCTVLEAEHELLLGEIALVSAQVDDLNEQLSSCCTMLDAQNEVLLGEIINVSAEVADLGAQLTSCCTMLDVQNEIILTEIINVSAEVEDISIQLNDCCMLLSEQNEFILNAIEDIDLHLSDCCAILEAQNNIILNDITIVSEKIDDMSTLVNDCCTMLSEHDEIILDGLAELSEDIADVDMMLTGCCATLSAVSGLILNGVNNLTTKVDALASQVGMLDNCLLGTPITQAMVPYTITQSGNYYLCGSVIAMGAPTITIATSDVHLDLNGFTVSNTDNRGIASSGAVLSNIFIENGVINTIALRAIELDDITNLTLRNLAMRTSAYQVCRISTVTNVYMEDCSATTDGAAYNCIELSAPLGAQLCNVHVYDSAAYGFRVFNTSLTAVTELINCTANMTENGFVLEGPGASILRSCTAGGSTSRGFVALGAPHILEDCVAHKNVNGGFWVQSAANVIIRNCIAEFSSAGSGFHARATTGLSCQGCIADNNALSGFHLEAAVGSNDNCTFETCLATNNAPYGFAILGSNTDTRIINSVASGNTGSGIHNLSPSTIIINTRSQRSASIMHPGYKLNGAVDMLDGGKIIFE